MRQAIVTRPGEIEFREAPLPTASNDQVLLAVKRIGICGSDVHVFRGQHPYTTYPIIQGHEVSGIVHSIGANVKGVSVGDRVTLTPQLVCGQCPSCREGNYNICDSLKVMGFQANGAGQEYYAVPEWNIIPLPDQIDIEGGAMIEPVAVAVHAVGRAAGVRGKRVLVLGAGTVGNLVAQVARALGASDVTITDLSEYRLAKARACGVGGTLPATRLSATMIELPSFDVAMECVGTEVTVRQALRSVRKGGTAVIVGVFPNEVAVEFGLIQDHELRVVGSAMYRKDDFARAMDLIAGGLVNIAELVTHRFSFREYRRAYAAIDAGPDKHMKVMIEIDHAEQGAQG